MTDKPVKPIVPLRIRYLAYALFAAGVFNILYSFTGATASQGRFYPAIQVALTIAMFLALSGILSMEKWGVWTFLGVIMAKVLVDYSVTTVDPLFLLMLIPAAIFIRGLLYRKQS